MSTLNTQNIVLICSDQRAEMLAVLLRDRLKLTCSVFSDLDDGIKGVISKRPLYIVLQDSIDSTPAEKAVRLISMLQAESPPVFIVMHDGNPMLQPVKGFIDHCIDLSEDANSIFLKIEEIIREKSGTARTTENVSLQSQKTSDKIPASNSKGTNGITATKTVNKPLSINRKADKQENETVGSKTAAPPKTGVSVSPLPETNPDPQAMDSDNTGYSTVNSSRNRIALILSVTAILLACLWGYLNFKIRPVPPAPVPPPSHTKPAPTGQNQTKDNSVPNPEKSLSSVKGLQPDNSFSVSNPGWEKFLLPSGTDIRLYREKGAVIAVQAFAGKQSALPEELLYEVLEYLAGSKTLVTEETKKEHGLNVVLATAGNNFDVKIISSANGTIKAFVVAPKQHQTR